jgi:nucleoside-diphosphate-sugar epimerase
MEKIIITGANGFIGSFLTKKLLENDFEVTSLVRYGSNIDLLPENSNIVFIDYDDEKKVQNVFQNKEILIHCAALTRALNWDFYKKINIDLTAKLVDSFNSTQSLKQFIFLSSQAAAGPSIEGEPLSENDVEHPISLYGKSKLEAENIIKQKSEKPWTIIRPVSVFGPGDKDFLRVFKLVKHHLALYIGSEEKLFNLIYIEDLVNVIIKTCGNRKAFQQIFFASDNEVYTMEKFIDFLEQTLTTFTNPIRIPEFLLNYYAALSELLGKLNNKVPLINKEKVAELKKKFWLVSNEKVKNLLDFKPQFDIQEGLMITFKWYKEKDWL